MSVTEFMQAYQMNWFEMAMIVFVAVVAFFVLLIIISEVFERRRRNQPLPFPKYEAVVRHRIFW